MQILVVHEYSVENLAFQVFEPSTDLVIPRKKTFEQRQSTRLMPCESAWGSAGARAWNVALALLARFEESNPHSLFPMVPWSVANIVERTFFKVTP